jgi:predicted aminopeptidase
MDFAHRYCHVERWVVPAAENSRDSRIGLYQSRCISHAVSVTLYQSRLTRYAFAAQCSKSLAAACLALMLSGCTNIGYYLQSVSGQLDIWRRERAIEEVISDPVAPAALKKKLAQVIQIRDFASRELGLPQNRSYRRYADLERPFVVWNVFATPEFSVEPVQWCFMFAGCVGYRGYFDKVEAERFAADLADQGRDVFVGGVPAYSTLGWFSDPVLNTFVRYPDPEVARLIFHELAHQVVYARDDSVFNESFAVAVEHEGVTRWLARHGNIQDKSGFERMQQHREGFTRLIGAYRERLEKLYRTGIAPGAMRERKARLFDDLRRDYDNLKADWGGFSGYDRWFATRPNNAQIASLAIYTQQVPAFQSLLRQQGGELARFYAAVKELAALPKAERMARLRQLMAAER